MIHSQEDYIVVSSILFIFLCLSQLYMTLQDSQKASSKRKIALITGITGQVISWKRNLSISNLNL